MIEIKDLHKSYKMGANSLHVLKGINFFCVRSTPSYVPCSAPQTTNVQAAPCQRPPNNIVIIKAA